MLVQTLSVILPPWDLTGICSQPPSLQHCRSRRQTLAHHYRTSPYCCDRLADLSIQACKAQLRPWQRQSHRLHHLHDMTQGWRWNRHLAPESRQRFGENLAHLAGES